MAHDWDDADLARVYAIRDIEARVDSLDDEMDELDAEVRELESRVDYLEAHQTDIIDAWNNQVKLIEMLVGVMKNGH